MTSPQKSSSHGKELSPAATCSETRARKVKLTIRFKYDLSILIHPILISKLGATCTGILQHCMVFETQLIDID